MFQERLDRERAAGGLRDQLLEAGPGTLAVDVLAQPAEQRGEVALADPAEVEAATQVMAGFLGPIGLRLRTIADLSIQGMRGAVAGANEADAHYIEVDQERDFTPSAFADGS